jgi:hypothetical protein
MDYEKRQLAIGEGQAEVLVESAHRVLDTAAALFEKAWLRQSEFPKEIAEKMGCAKLAERELRNLLGEIRQDMARWNFGRESREAK